ncbi:MAG: hypothetical protein SCH71_16995 [Desulfobulbaceae bacterium]|nr:hypothetical protein [Desulfobulbaceae bacterium]
MISSINQTLLNSWGMCGERVRRRWIENEVIPPGIAAKIGTGVHKGAEINHLAKMQTGKDEPLDVVTDAARDGYIESLESGVFFSHEELPRARTVIAEGVDTVVSFAKLYHSEMAPRIQPALVEEKILMEVDDLPIPFSGIVDVYTTDKILPDIKTAGKSWSQADADSKLQPTLYRELIKFKTGEYPDKITFELFIKTKTPKHALLETTRTREDFICLKRRASLMIQSINAGIFPPAEPGHWCCSPRWCGYFYTCKHIPPHQKILPKRSE